MRLFFIPIGRGAYPLWWTCYSSSSAVRLATVKAVIGCGSSEATHRSLVPATCLAAFRYQVMWSTCCLVSVQLSSHTWPASSKTCLILWPPAPLMHPVMTVLHDDRETVAMFFLDLSTDSSVIQLVQLYAQEPGPTNSWVRCAHTTELCWEC